MQGRLILRYNISSTQISLGHCKQSLLKQNSKYRCSILRDSFTVLSIQLRDGQMGFGSLLKKTTQLWTVLRFFCISLYQVSLHSYKSSYEEDVINKPVLLCPDLQFIAEVNCQICLVTSTKCSRDELILPSKSSTIGQDLTKFTLDEAHYWTIRYNSQCSSTFRGKQLSLNRHSVRGKQLSLNGHLMI